MTKIAVGSDLHLEFQDLVIENTENAEVLILSGDILIAEDLHGHPAPDPYAPGGMASFSRRLESATIYRNFIQQCSEKFPHVIAVAGNHEFYHGKFHGSLDVLRKEYGKYPNVHFLENESIKIGDTTFLGASLWTDMNKGDPITMQTLSTYMNDYQQIRNDKLGYMKLRPEHVLARHKETMEYFTEEIEKDPTGNFVLVVHHSPSKLSTHPRYKNDFHINGGYSSDLSDFILDHPQIKLITHGHTHYAFSYMIGTTRIECNPRGYCGYEPMADQFELKFLEV